MQGRQQSDDSVSRDSRHDYWGAVLEAPDAGELARFYARLLGWELNQADPVWATVYPSDGVGYLGFQTSPEYVPPVWPSAEGRQQMQLHLDFEVSDLESAAADAVEMGATVAEFQPQDNVRVLLDPVGHPFCLYVGD